MPHNKKTHKLVTIYPKIEIYEKIAQDAKKQNRAVKYIIEKIVENHYENVDKVNK